MRASRFYSLGVAFLFAAALSACTASRSGGEEAPFPAGFQKGVAFTGYWSDAYAGDGPLRSMDALKSTKAGWVSVLVTAYQENIASTVIDFQGPSTPTDDSLIRLIGYARGIGLKVMLKPHVDLANDPQHYRGDIGRNFSEADWAAWFASYTAFILHYAEMAAGAGAELFCVGCELGGTVGRAAEWRQVISRVRGVFNGPLVYADNLVETNPGAVSWWDALDYIGQDLYPTLSLKVHPTVDDLCAGWPGLREKLRSLAGSWNKKVIVTEIGCRSVEGGAINPWDWQKSGQPDMEVQSNYYEAAFRMLQGQSWLAGMYWWQWMPEPDHGGTLDTGYSPHLKPAETVLRSWYGRQP
jgi:hypothetical protein